MLNYQRADISVPTMLLRRCWTYQNVKPPTRNEIHLSFAFSIRPSLLKRAMSKNTHTCIRHPQWLWLWTCCHSKNSDGKTTGRGGANTTNLVIGKMHATHPDILSTVPWLHRQMLKMHSWGYSFFLKLLQPFMVVPISRSHPRSIKLCIYIYIYVYIIDTVRKHGYTYIHIYTIYIYIYICIND